MATKTDIGVDLTWAEMWLVRNALQIVVADDGDFSGVHPEDLDKYEAVEKKFDDLLQHRVVCQWWRANKLEESRVGTIIEGKLGDSSIVIMFDDNNPVHDGEDGYQFDLWGIGAGAAHGEYQYFEVNNSTVPVHIISHDDDPTQ